MEFMESIGEEIVDGHLTLLEAILIKAIVMYCIIHGTEVSPDNVINFYTKSYNLAQECTSVQFPLFARDLSVEIALVLFLTVTVNLSVCV